MNDITDYETIQSLTSQREELATQLEQESERWMELLEKQESQ